MQDLFKRDFLHLEAQHAAASDDYADVAAIALQRITAANADASLQSDVLNWAKDPYVLYASRTLGVPPWDVTSAQRRVAKQLYFAKSYGLAPLSDAATLHHPADVASDSDARRVVPFTQYAAQAENARIAFETMRRLLCDGALGSYGLIYVSEAGSASDASDALPSKQLHEYKAPQWYPQETRESAPSGDVPRAKVLKNRAAAKAALKARKKARK